MTALLDTHILIWWLSDGNRLSPVQQEVVASASAESPLLVSDISLWEVATLHSLGRIQLTIPLRAWLDKAVAPLSWKPMSGSRANVDNFGCKGGLQAL